jgi:hypothetical protein
LNASAASAKGRVIVYAAALEGVPIAPQHEVDVRFGELARLVGYSLERQEVAAGQELDLTLYWEAIPAAPVTGDYKVFVHLLDAAGEIVAQHDGEPASGRRPTRTWRSGDTVIDVHRLAWQERTPAGQLMLAVGLYDGATMERLPAYDAQGQRWPDDRAVLGGVTVK